MNQGQVIALDSTPRWWQVWLFPIYACIRHYQRLKWGRYYRATHVYLVLPRRTNELWLFEQTWPVARWAHPTALKNSTYAICEWTGHGLNVCDMTDMANSRIGNKYDLGDLLDFGLSGFYLRIFRRVVRVFGDRATRSMVCSTMVATLLKACGCYTIDRPIAVDPAYFENHPGWRVVARYVKGEKK